MIAHDDYKCRGCVHKWIQDFTGRYMKNRAFIIRYNS